MPFSGSVLPQLSDELAGYTMTKSALHLPVDRPPPRKLVKKLIGCGSGRPAQARANQAGERQRGERMHESSENRALERLDALVGEWTLEAGPAGGAPWPGEAAVTFEWLRGRAFVIERWAVPTAFDGIAIIGPGEELDRFRRHYFDGRGEQRIYEMTLRDGVWKQWRDAPDPFPQRFTAEFDDDGETISGRWEKAPDGSAWEPDIDVTYRKMS